MPLSTTATLVEHARAHGHGVPAFNVITLEHAEAIAEGAERVGAAAILQISENAVRFHSGRLAPLAKATASIAEAAAVPLSVHFDHVEDAALFEQVLGTGISSVMVDASKLEFSANVAATKAAADWGHTHGLWVEAELGEVGGKDGAHAPGVRTDPDEARRYVEATGVDGLAVAVGSSHAMVDRTARLDLDLTGRLAEAVGAPLVLHGSSGVPDDVLAGAVAAGIVKVNIGTILNVAFTGHIRQYLADQGASVDPRKYLRGARAAAADVVAHLTAVIATPERLP